MTPQKNADFVALQEKQFDFFFSKFLQFPVLPLPLMVTQHGVYANDTSTYLPIIYFFYVIKGNKM